MRTLDATVEIRPDGSVELHLGGNLEPGEHHGVLVLDEPVESLIRPGSVLSLPPLPLGFVPELTFSRDEISG